MKELCFFELPFSLAILHGFFFFFFFFWLPALVPLSVLRPRHKYFKNFILTLDCG